MKIGINASFLRKPGTGIGQVVLYFLRTLAQSEAGKRHDFILYLEADADTAFLPQNFQKRIFLPLWKRDDLLRKMLWEKRVAHEALRDDCEVFLSLSQSATIFPARQSADKKRGPLRHIMVVHDIIPRIFPLYQGNIRQAFHWKLVERGMQAAQHIIAVSEHTKKDLMRELHIGEEKISVAYPDVAPQFHTTVSPEAGAAVLQRYALKPGYIYHGGGLEIRKNAETLLWAYKKLREKRQSSGMPLPPDLVISGRLFPESNRLATPIERIIRELGLTEQVRLLGFVPDADMPALYAGALFFVYPSLYEGFGLPLLEAMRMRVPVLASQTAALPEVGGDAVLFVDPTDVNALVTEMEHLLDDGALRQTLVARGQAQAARFTWDHFVKKIWEAVE